MTKKPEKNGRYSACTGMGVFLLFIALCICAGSVSATTYTASDQNANGQYQIIYNVNPDNSQTFQAAGVAYGTMEVNNPPSGSPSGSVTSQDVSMSGQYGYAVVAAQDSSGNQADSETWLYNGDAHVFQAAGIVGTTQDSVGDVQNQIVDPVPIVPFTGAWAAQCVYSRNASAIIADTDSQNIYGSAADVNAQATGITSNNNNKATPDLESYGFGSCSVFRVSQWAGAFTPTAAITGTYSVIRSLPSVAVATQEGTVKGADTASVSTLSTTENGLSSFVSASVSGGGLPVAASGYSTPHPIGQNSYLDFDMQSVAENVSGLFRSGYGTHASGPEYSAKSEAEITASGTSGTSNTFSSGPNGQYAGANVIYGRETCGASGTYGICSSGPGGKIDIDLSASSKLNDHVEVTKVENELSHLNSYGGTVTAFNSAGDSDASTFDWNRRAGGVAGVVSDSGSGEIWASWAHTWPNPI